MFWGGRAHVEGELQNCTPGRQCSLCAGIPMAFNYFGLFLIVTAHLSRQQLRRLAKAMSSKSLHLSHMVCNVVMQGHVRLLSPGYLFINLDRKFSRIHRTLLTFSRSLTGSVLGYASIQDQAQIWLSGFTSKSFEIQSKATEMLPEFWKWDASSKENKIWFGRLIRVTCNLLLCYKRHVRKMLM